MSDTLSGLLHALLLDGNGGGRALTWPEVQQWTPAQGVLWLHLDYSEAAVQTWLEQDDTVPPLARAALLAEDSRPRCSPMGEGFLMALRGVNPRPESDPDDLVSLRLFLTESRLITTRRRPLEATAEIVGKVQQGIGPKGSMACVVALAQALVRPMEAIVDTFEERIDGLEESLVAEQGEVDRNSLTQLRQQVIALRRYLSPQREALSRLASERQPWIPARHQLWLREVLDHLSRHIEGIDEVRERAALIQEELLGRASEELNGRMYMLSIIAAIFLPLGFLTGLLGINVGGIPGEGEHWAFWAVVFGMFAVVALQLWLLRWKRWL
ncbi:zinc transporter ZntB [Ferrimonas balearica]|uniref:zinc transporter ZntB n=1 Tax=Ferrimonas balearica TaxID=44012 RepID=UPI001C585DAC|nr:zinc transporter ZntB [Ferrimonas balearica]MBW3139772.1 zinc transporter ZntB [Ferrimonas balearica]MBW3164796.1 zinc transporter ZntB [Ferrimonas balearica]MBY6107122.1 zinc transporter ZntB [Ferrimonas balearica]